MIGNLILLVYVLGLLVTFALAAWYLGHQWLELDTERQGHYEAFSRGEKMVGRGLGCVFGIGLWPLALPFLLIFHFGYGHARSLQETRKHLAEANAELDRIRKQEGWL